MKALRCFEVAVNSLLTSRHGVTLATFCHVRVSFLNLAWKWTRCDVRSHCISRDIDQKSSVLPWNKRIEGQKGQDFTSLDLSKTDRRTNLFVWGSVPYTCLLSSHRSAPCWYVWTTNCIFVVWACSFLPASAEVNELDTLPCRVGPNGDGEIRVTAALPQKKFAVKSPWGWLVAVSNRLGNVRRVDTSGAFASLLCVYVGFVTDFKKIIDCAAV